MTRYIFDIETDGFVDSMTRIHSLVMKDIDTGHRHSYAGVDKLPENAPDSWDIGVELGLRRLMEADEIIGHNIIKFDIPAIQKIYPWFQPKGRVTDTLVIVRLIWPDIRERDFTLRKQIAKHNLAVERTGKGELRPEFPGNLIGRHGLEAYGYRMGLMKGEYAKEMKAKGLDPWAKWNPLMQEYCEQDVVVTSALWDKIVAQNYSQQAIDLEHQFQHVIFEMERTGFCFDVEAGQELYAKLSARRTELDYKLQELYPPKEVPMRSAWFVHPETGEEWATKKQAQEERGAKYAKALTAGRLKTKTVPFNPSSRDHIAERLGETRGWKPKDFTQDGKPKVDEEVLSTLKKWPEVELLLEHFLVEKRIGQLAEGNQAWLKLETNGRIHGSVITNGAVTGRCTHNSPNVAQVPKVGSPYGKECRSLFRAPAGWKLVGCDFSGLELRCLAHFMALYDGGEYAKLLLEGDIHTANQLAAGLPTRDNAKTFIYGFLYGAGDAKIGQIVGKGAKRGRELKTQFLDKTPALKKLREMVLRKVERRGHLIGLDGRKLHIRSPHSALNTLLQSAGALLSKQGTVLLYETLKANGWEYGRDWALCAHIHDEVQLICPPERAEELGAACVEAFRAAGRFFNFQCPIDAEFKIGDTWADTH